MTMGKTLREEADHWLPQAKGMPIIALSGMHGDGLDKLMKAVIETYQVWNKRVSTSIINRCSGTRACRRTRRLRFPARASSCAT